MPPIGTPVTRKSNIIVQEFESELLVYDLSINKAFCLNRTSALVYKLCDGTRSVADISDVLGKQLQTLVSEELVWLALDGLKKDNLLENSEQFDVDFHGLNRRQVIKKVGFVSMVMLPVISSVVAPSAAMAQSGRLANCAACTANSQCGSLNCLNNVCSVGTTNSFAPGTRLGAPFGTTFPTCQALAVPNCCSGLPQWFVTGNCFCA